MCVEDPFRKSSHIIYIYGGVFFNPKPAQLFFKNIGEIHSLFLFELVCIFYKSIWNRCMQLSLKNETTLY